MKLRHFLLAGMLAVGIAFLVYVWFHKPTQEPRGSSAGSFESARKVGAPLQVSDDSPVLRGEAAPLLSDAISQMSSFDVEQEEGASQQESDSAPGAAKEGLVSSELAVVVLAGGRPIVGASVRVGEGLNGASDSEGRCHLSGLIPGQTTVEAVAPEGHAVSRTVLRPGPNSVVLVLSGPVDLNVTVRVDAPGEEAVVGAKVELRLPTRVVQGMTGGDGSALLSGLPPGSFALDVRAEGFADWHGNAEVFLPEREKANRKDVFLRPGEKVCGTVVSAEWEPIAGATVWAVAHDIGSGNGWMRCGPEGRGTTTNEEGSYCLTLEAGSYQILASAGGATGQSEALSVGVEPLSSVTLLLSRAGSIEGVVVTEDGTTGAVGLVEVRVSAESVIGNACAREVEASVPTAPDGTFLVGGLRPARYVVRAFVGTSISDHVHVDLSGGADATGIRLLVGSEATISGIVSSRGGQPAPGVAVYASAERSPSTLLSSHTVYSDSAGAFHFEGLDAGAYRLLAGKPAIDPTTYFHFGRGSGTKAHTGDKDVRLVVADAGGVKGRVVRADGVTPVTDFGVQMAMFPMRWFKKEDGRFEFMPWNPGTYRVQLSAACCDDLDLGEKTVEQGQVLDLGSIVLEDGREITGRVLDDNGEGLAGALLRCGTHLPATTTGKFLPAGARKAVSELDGFFSVAGLPSEPLAILARHENGCRSKVLKIPVGKAPVSIELTCLPTASLAGEAFIDNAPAEARTVFLVPKGIQTAFTLTKTSQDGSFEFPDVSVGQYVVALLESYSALGGHEYRKAVELTQGEAMHLELLVATGPLEVTLRAVDADCDEDGIRFVLLKGDGLTMPEQGLAGLEEQLGNSETWMATRTGSQSVEFARLLPGGYLAYRQCVSDDSGVTQSDDPSYASTLRWQVFELGPSGPHEIVLD
jgi:hypothetical protein